MEIVHKLIPIIKKSYEYANEILDSVKEDKEVKHENLLYNCDNIEAIKKLLDLGYKNSIDLIYLDPPFFTKANYKKRSIINYKRKEQVIEHQTYGDTWKGGFEEYLYFIATRLILMRELLSHRGTIYVHVDYRAVHYIKIIMDSVFGMDKFLNEVIWSYKSGGSTKKSYAKKHDNILVYTKTKKYIFNPQKEKSYNRDMKPYRFKGVKEYEDHLGWYTLVNLKDVWNIDMVGRTSKERVGFETQKPIALLERIILASSNEDSIVADFFMGSGTTIETASKHNRKWIGADNSNSSMLTTIERLRSKGFNDYRLINLNKENMGNNLSVKYNIKIDDNNLDKLEVYLEDYSLNLDQIMTDDKNKTIIKNVLENDFISLISYINIRIDNEEGHLIYEDMTSKENPRINEKIFFKTEDSWDKLIIEVIDIFGNREIKTIINEKGKQDG